jgi:hypothetical protein
LWIISENGIIEKDPFATSCAYAKFQQKITFQTITLFLVDDLKGNVAFGSHNYDQGSTSHPLHMNSRCFLSALLYQQ